MIRHTAALTVMATAILFVFAIACGEDDSQAPAGTAIIEAKEATETRAATATTVRAPATATSTTGAAAGSSGIPELDVVIDALRSGDAETLRPLLGFSEVACNTEGFVGLTMCRPGEEAGELVEVFRFIVCEGQNLRPDDLGQALNVLAEAELYAVYLAPDDERYLDADYVALVSFAAPVEERVAWEVHVEDGRIVKLGFTCAVPIEEYAEQFQDAVLPP